MQAHAIVEIEEGTLNLLVGAHEGGVTRVLHSLRMPLAELGREALVAALRTIGSDVFQGAEGVHVILGDRRSQHFVSTVPRMPSADVLAFVRREASRLSNLSAISDLLLATRVLEPLPGGRFLLGTTTAMRASWAPLAAAFEDCDLAVLGLHTMGSCLALASNGTGGATSAVLDVNAGRARFVLCRQQSPVQVRRFLIGGGGGESNAAAIATQLAMELPRTIDWLRDSGHPMPRVILLGPRLGLDDDALSMLAGIEDTALLRATLAVECDEQQATPTLGSAALLDCVCQGRCPLPSLLDAPRVALPWSGRRMLMLAAAAAIGAIGSTAAVVDGGKWLELRRQLAQVEAENDELANTITAAQQVLLERSRPDPRLTHALSMRRPVSRLFADVSNAADDRVHVEEFTFSSTEAMALVGKVEGVNRHDALGAIGQLTARLRRLPYVQIDGQEEIGEVQDRWNVLKFRLNLAWRNQ